MVWAAFFNFIAFVVFPLHVAHTIGKGIIDPKIVDDAVLFGALGGAIAWNLITWFYGLPSSSSHALVGGLIGAGFCKGGSAVIQSGVAKTALFIVDLAGARDAARRRPDGAGRRGCCGASSPARSIAGSGGCSSSRRRCSASATARNDAQKTMGIIMAMLIAEGSPHRDVATLPMWVILSCQLAMGLGTLSGGWRIVKTMGMRLTQAQAGRRLLRRDGGGRHAVPGERAGRTGVDNAHDHGRHRRRRLVTPPVERALAGRLPDRLGVVVHDPVRGADQRRDLYAALRALGM